jgi:hypothetical protein
MAASSSTTAATADVGSGYAIVPATNKRGRSPADIEMDKRVLMNYNLNPSRLTTRIMTNSEFDPSCGDVYFPDDMIQVFETQKDPTFDEKSMVFVGPQGSGKTSLNNRITLSDETTGVDLRSVTRKKKIRQACGPAAALKCVDTPGTADSGMPIDDAFELRSALIHGTVSQVNVVVPYPTSTRSSALLDLLSLSLNNLMDCECFRRDSYGMDRGPRSSLYRTRVFLIVTHRDRSLPEQRELWPTLIAEVRNTFPWIGAVAIIDEHVSIGWIYDTIVACAGYQWECCQEYSIPVVEMFLKFQIKFDSVEDHMTEEIYRAKEDLAIGMSAAIAKMNSTVAAREGQGSLGGGAEDLTVPTLDAISRFIDDLYENKVHDTLAKCYDQEIGDLWLDDDLDKMNQKVNTMNVIKMKLAQELSYARKKLASLFPTNGYAAVYKACVGCGQVFTKPTGCDGVGNCGNGGVTYGSGRMVVKMEYDYTGNQLNLRQGGAGSPPGVLETTAWGLRRSLATVQDKYSQLVKHEVGNLPTLDNTNFKGCGLPLRWDDASTLRALTPAELIEKKLVADDDVAAVQCEPCVASKTQKIEVFLESCGAAFTGYADKFRENGIHRVMNFVIVEPYQRASILDSLFPDMPAYHKNVLLQRFDNFV